MSSRAALVASPSTLERWEAGSWNPFALPAGGGWRPDPARTRLYGSGRQALIALLEHGRKAYGFSAVHVPEYYCPQVVADLTQTLPVLRYDSGPVGAVGPRDVGPADVVITVSYFGAPPALVSHPDPRSVVVVDATHDPMAPWLATTPADYAFASLRKTMPLPDGGALWSLGNRTLPAEPVQRDGHRLAVLNVLSAMCLKRGYLAGAAVAKERYLNLYAAGEAGIATATVSGISDYSRQALRALAVRELSRRRRDNSEVLADALRCLPGVTVRAYPMGVVLEFDTPLRRDLVRAELIERNVYPAVLWALPPEAPAHHRDYSRRMLFLHCDFRSDQVDLRRIASLVRQVDRMVTSC